MTEVSTLTAVISTLVAAEMLFIFYLETFATTSRQTARVFGMEQEELRQPSVQSLFRNQGIYNAAIGIMLLLALYVWVSPVTVIFLLCNVVGVAAYGGLSVSPSIFFKQGTLAVLALLSMLI